MEQSNISSRYSTQPLSIPTHWPCFPCARKWSSCRMGVPRRIVRERLLAGFSSNYARIIRIWNAWCSKRDSIPTARILLLCSTTICALSLRQHQVTMPVYLLNFSQTIQSEVRITHTYRCVNGVSLNKSNLGLLINVLEYWQFNSKGKGLICSVGLSIFLSLPKMYTSLCALVGPVDG